MSLHNLNIRIEPCEIYIYIYIPICVSIKWSTRVLILRDRWSEWSDTCFLRVDCVFEIYPSYEVVLC
jgi:hypothetical protein